MSAQLKAGADALLWSEEQGVYLASTGVERDRVDVWGNALAGASGFADASQAQSIFNFMRTREADLFYEGQVREIPKPHQWEVAMGLQAPPRGAPVGPQSTAGATAVVYVQSMCSLLGACVRVVVRSLLHTLPTCLLKGE